MIEWLKKAVFYLTCPLQWNARPFMTGLYATGTTASSPYYFRDYQNLSGTTYQNQKLVKMADATSYYNFCNPTGGTSFITSSEMGNMYAPIQSAYYREDNGLWVNGEIDHWYGSQGYTVTFNQNGVYLYVDNSTPYGLDVFVTVRAYEPDSDYYDYDYEILYMYNTQSISSWGTMGGYYFIEYLTPEGEIGSIDISVDASGRNLPFSATIELSGGNMMGLSGTTDGGYVRPNELAYDIEIHRVDIIIST